MKIPLIMAIITIAAVVFAIAMLQSGDIPQPSLDTKKIAENWTLIPPQMNEEFILQEGQETVIEGNTIRLLDIIAPDPDCLGGAIGCPTQIKLSINDQEISLASRPVRAKTLCCPSEIISGLNVTLAEHPSGNSVKLTISSTQ